jgi:hypothetical protein
MAANSSYLDSNVAKRMPIQKIKSNALASNEYLENSSIIAKKNGRHDSNPTALQNLKYI